MQDLRTGAVEVVEVPDPRPGAKEVLVRTTWSVISPGTEQAIAKTAGKGFVGKARERPDQARKVIDKALAEGLSAARSAVSARLDDSLTPGYSSAGVVEEVGPGWEGVRVGDRVACFGANAACHAERVVVPGPLCLALPEPLEDRAAAFCALGAIAAHGVRLADVRPGEVVVVLGLGLVGQLTAQLVTAAGGRAIGADPVLERRELAHRLGAAGVGPPDAAALADPVGSLSDGYGADAVIIAAATKDSGPLALAAELARDRAVVTAVGDVGLDVPRRPFFEKELQLRISRSYGPGRYDDEYEVEGHDYPIGYVRWTERRLVRYFLEEVAAGRVVLDELVSHEFGIEEGEKGYEALEAPGRMGILIRYPDRPGSPLERSVLVTRPPGTSGRRRIGLVGPGMFARSTLLPLLEGLDADLVAVAGRSPARAVAAGRRGGAEYAVTDVDQILDDDTIDAIVIATRHDSHAELSRRALERGKAVFLEKPLAIRETELDELAAHLTSEARLVVDFNRGFAPSVRTLQRHFEGRSDPLHISYRVNAGYLEPDHWTRRLEEGGGRLVGEGCHMVDLCSQLVGSRVAKVQVSGLGAGPRTHLGDNFELVLSYEDGSVAAIAYVATGSARVGKERIEVIGAGRTGLIDDFKRPELYSRRSLPQPPGLRRDKGHAAILEAALRFFGEGGQPPVPYERIIETTRVTLVAREALVAGDSSPRSIRPAA